jgi:hypothetical protein
MSSPCAVFSEVSVRRNPLSSLPGNGMKYVLKEPVKATCFEAGQGWWFSLSSLPGGEVRTLS